MRRFIGLGLAVAALGVGAACGGGSDGAAAPDDGAPPGDGAAATVQIATFQFTPKALTAKVGDTVRFENGDDILHTATSGTREYDPGDSGKVVATDKDGVFDIQLDGRGSTGSHTFTKAGTYHYFCDRHPGMEADITVT